MAEDVLGKLVQQLKKERTTAKSSFTRQANFISRGASSMLQEELKEEFTKLSDCFRKMLDANDDYRIGLEADIKTEDTEASLDETQEADIDRSVEGETKLAEIRNIVQTNLRSTYGKSELDVAIQEAEKANDRNNKSPKSIRPAQVICSNTTQKSISYDPEERFLPTAVLFLGLRVRERVGQIVITY